MSLFRRKPRQPAAPPAPPPPTDGQLAARNAETDRLRAYHEATKHTYLSVHRSGWSLDWDNQPNPFRRWAGAPRVELPAPKPTPTRATSACLLQLGDERDGRWPESALPAVSSLLHHALAVSAWKAVPGTDVRYSLRVNPSSGNLHPTECWLAAAGLADLPDGLYHYDVRGHALECRRAGPAVSALVQAAGLPTGGRGLIAVLGSIFWRESWKYRDRAYRYCLHDAGHAAGALASAACALDLPARVHGHFADAEVHALCALHGTGEQPLLLVDLRERPPADAPAPPAAPATLGAPRGEPNALSREEFLWPLIDGAHASTLLPRGPCPSARAGAPPPPSPDATSAGAAARLALPPGTAGTREHAEVARGRRSAIDYLPEARTDLAGFAGLLREACTLPPCDFLGTAPPTGGRPPARLVALYVYAHRVDGLPPGCWLYLPDEHALTLVRAGDVRSLAAGLSLGQELAGHAIAAFSMVADFDRALSVFGNRGYRHAHVEAGLIGQGLYLAAEARGLQATGIGAFYDDDVHRALGLLGGARQVIYHHSVGRAAPDPRLVDADSPAEMRDGD